MAKSVNLGSNSWRASLLLPLVLLCVKVMHLGTSLTISNINNIRSQVKTSMYTRAGFTKVLFRGKQYKVRTKGNRSDYVPDFVTVTLQVSLKEGEVSLLMVKSFLIILKKV